MHSHEFATSLEKNLTEQQAKQLLHNYLLSFNFNYYAFTYYSAHTKTGQKLYYHCASESLQPWHLYYLEQSYADVDRTLEEAHTTILPVFWDIPQQLALAKNGREQRIRQESIEFGLDKGLSVPVHGPNRDFATLTLHQAQNETCLNNYKLHQYEWLSAAYIFYHHIKKILILTRAPSATYQLTEREQQCLALTAKSWRIEQIAKELRISPRTVNFHIQNANKKLGVNNKYQAINKYFQCD
jgi:LuxR family transcriptional activator of bioluminescence operon